MPAIVNNDPVQLDIVVSVKWTAITYVLEMNVRIKRVVLNAVQCVCGCVRTTRSRDLSCRCQRELLLCPSLVGPCRDLCRTFQLRREIFIHSGEERKSEERRAKIEAQGEGAIPTCI